MFFLRSLPFIRSDICSRSPTQFLFGCFLQFRVILVVIVIIVTARAFITRWPFVAFTTGWLVTLIICNTRRLIAIITFLSYLWSFILLLFLLLHLIRYTRWLPPRLLLIEISAQSWRSLCRNFIYCIVSISCIARTLIIAWRSCVWLLLVLVWLKSVLLLVLCVVVTQYNILLLH